MPGRLPSIVSTGGVWRSATSACLVVGWYVADTVVVVGRYDGDDPIVQARLETWGTNSLPWLPDIMSLVVGAFLRTLWLGAS